MIALTSATLEERGHKSGSDCSNDLVRSVVLNVTFGLIF